MLYESTIVSDIIISTQIKKKRDLRDLFNSNVFVVKKFIPFIAQYAINYVGNLMQIIELIIQMQESNIQKIKEKINLRKLF